MLRRSRFVCSGQTDRQTETGWWRWWCSGNPSPRSSFCARRAAGSYLCALAQLSPPALVHRADTRRRVSDRPNPPFLRQTDEPGERQDYQAATTRSCSSERRTSPPTEWVKRAVFRSGEAVLLCRKQPTYSFVCVHRVSRGRGRGVSPDSSLRCRVEISRVIAGS